MGYIEDKVHDLYWKEDINCARTMLTCLSELFQISLEQQTMFSAIGMHGAGGFRAQCGLVEGGLMFIGIYYKHQGKPENTIVLACYEYARKFTLRFGSITCHDLRPTGFNESDPPHMCEKLTCEAVDFTSSFIEENIYRQMDLTEV